MTEEFIFELWFLSLIVVAIGIGLTVNALNSIQEEIEKLKEP